MSDIWKYNVPAQITSDRVYITVHRKVFSPRQGNLNPHGEFSVRINPSWYRPEKDVYDVMDSLMRLVRTAAEGRLDGWDPLAGRAMHPEPLYMRINIWQAYTLSSDDVVRLVVTTLESYRAMFRPKWQILVL